MFTHDPEACVLLRQLPRKRCGFFAGMSRELSREVAGWCVIAHRSSPLHAPTALACHRARETKGFVLSEHWSFVPAVEQEQQQHRLPLAHTNTPPRLRKRWSLSSTVSLPATGGGQEKGISRSSVFAILEERSFLQSRRKRPGVCSRSAADLSAPQGASRATTLERSFPPPAWS